MGIPQPSVPLFAAISLAALATVSFARSGKLTPAGPQWDGNEGYRQLWLGNAVGLGGAADKFRAALEADPAFPYRWSDLGDALLADPSADAQARARYCFGRALELAPHDPQIALRAANFHFRVGETDTALRLDADVLRLVPDYDQTVFLAYRRMGGNLERVLNLGIDANPRAAGQFLRYLSDRPDHADTVWSWAERRGYITPPLALFRAGWLLARSRPAEAFSLRARYLLPSASPERVENPGFETVLADNPFDWRSEPCPGVAVSRDEKRAHSGAASLRLTFDGSGNTDFHHIGQPAWLEPGQYRLTAWIRTENLTTDEGVAVDLNAGSLAASTPSVTDTHDWAPVSIDFTVSDPAVLGRLEILRRPSARFENRPRGTAWVDDVSLVRVGYH